MLDITPNSSNPQTDYNWFAQLGREAALSIAELQSLTGAQLSFDISSQIAQGQTPEPIDWDRFGGIIRSGKIIFEATSDFNDINNSIINNCLKGSGKITLGLTCTDNCLSRSQYTKLQKDLKLRLRQSGRSVRFVPAANGQALNAAQVIHNRLTSRGKEFVIWKTANGWQVGLTEWIQDIDSYSLRDRQRPKRDAAIGMLPPKLAQIMINLANPTPGGQVYDPFCGTGVVLIEASRMGLIVSGSDNDPAMVSATQDNMTWYQDYNSKAGRIYSAINLQDAAHLKLPSGKTSIVSEGYLGRVDLKWMGLSLDKVEAEAAQLDKFYSQVIKHWRTLKQVDSIVLALPFWHINGRDIRLKLLDDIAGLGYTCQQFASSESKLLTYRREQQVVGRMIVHLTPTQNI